MDWQAVSRTIWRSYIVRALVRRTFGRSGEWDDRAIGRRSIGRTMASIGRTGALIAFVRSFIARSPDRATSCARLSPVRPIGQLERSSDWQAVDRSDNGVDRAIGRCYTVRALVCCPFGRSGSGDDRAIGRRSVDRTMASIGRAGALICSVLVPCPFSVWWFERWVCAWYLGRLVIVGSFVGFVGWVGAWYLGWLVIVGSFVETIDG